MEEFHGTGGRIMGYVHCPFCGARVTVGSDGSVEPKCPRCGAWAARDAAGGGSGSGEPQDEAGVSTTMGATMALETRSVEGPAGEVSFVRAPYAGDFPDGFEL